MILLCVLSLIELYRISQPQAALLKEIFLKARWEPYLFNLLELAIQQRFFEPGHGPQGMVVVGRDSFQTRCDQPELCEISGPHQLASCFW